MNRTIFTLLLLAVSALARDAKLTRYPTYHQGRVAFSYMGDIWVADESGSNLQRLTANAARDVYPRFSPDGKWVAFSSDRNGNLDVFIMPAKGGEAKQLTFHSADDTVLGWTPDSRSVLFSSQRGEDFMAKLYTIGIEGGMERNAGADMGIAGSYSPDGKKLAINRKGQVYWRKYYRGAYQTDVTVMDLATRKFTDVTTFNGLDSWPMWAHDGFIYFVSDRDGNGLTNIWRVPENGKDAQAQKVTAFTTGDVRFPSISADGKTIVFEHDFGISKLDVATKRVTPLKFDIAAEAQDNMSEVREFTSQVDEYHLAPNGRRIVFSIHGEIFSAPVDQGDLFQVTDNPARDKSPVYSPDGKHVAFISDRNGREEIYLVAPDGSGEPQRITDLDVLKQGMTWSPDSKSLAFTTSDEKLYVYDTAAKQSKMVVASRYGNLNGATWSPDGKWFAYSRPDQSRVSNIYLVPSAGGQEHKITFDSSGERQPRFSADGKKLYFVRNEGGGGGRGGRGGGAAAGGAQIYVIALERQDKDPDDPEDRAEPDDNAAPAQGGGRGAGRGGQNAANQPVKDVNIDWDGIKRRTLDVTRMPYGVQTYIAAYDSRTLILTTSEPSGGRNTPAIYSVQDDGRQLSRIGGGSAAGDDAAGRGGRGRGAGGGGFGGINSLNLTRDGRTLFYQEGGAVYSVTVGGGGGGGTAGGAGRGAAASAANAPAGGGARRQVTFTAKVKINKPAEWAEMFDDAWRTMKYRFYDANMHGFNWDAARSKYQPLVEFVADKHELLNIVNEMIGELNASHTGAAVGPGGRGGGVQTSHLGLDLVADEKAGRFKVAYVYADGPCDKDWVKVKAGDYLIAIDGTPVTSETNYWKLLNSVNRLNRKVVVTFNDKPAEDGAWKTRIEPITAQAFNQLRYERWVKDRRAEVEKLSGGKIGYLHIQAMDQPSLAKFEKEIRENRDKKALVIDQRWNGGGNIEQELLAILVQREYQIWRPRGTEETGRPFAGFFGPKVVLQNWRSASNAEMFPAGFKALGLGKTIGTPTMGAVIGTGSYSLIDGSTVRTPGVGVFLADGKHTNMENYGVQPDILIENSPEDNLSGKDRQLETAVESLLKEIGGAK
jgi:tricorn protease